RETSFVDVRRDDAGCASRFADADREQADRSTARHQYRRAGNLSAQRSVECVAHRIVNAANVERDVVVEMPDVRRGHRDVLGEAPVAVDTDDLRVGTDVRIAGAAQQTPSVDDMTLRGHAIAFVHVGHQLPDPYDV